MSLISTFRCDVVQAATADTVGQLGADAVLVTGTGTGQVTGFEVSASKGQQPTLQLQKDNILGHGPFLHLTVNGTPYKVQLDSVV